MNNEFQSLKGHLLLDAGGMYGSSFHHSIILICQHSPEGAFGLVLNQPTENCVGEVLPFNLPPDVKRQFVRNGGPVDEQSVHILHSDAFMFQGNVLNNLSLMQDLNDLNDLENSVNPDQKIGVFTGYSGWGAGQIESELARKSWLIHPASTELIFNKSNQSDWRNLLRQMDWQQRLLANGPDDLSWN
ncbi:MAG: YqgE/AlgH family protein [Limisphaerales bacterium]|nr:MAG: YqgE/AlgH family protein [Limisphaerales bacterium]